MFNDVEYGFYDHECEIEDVAQKIINRGLRGEKEFDIKVPNDFDKNDLARVRQIVKKYFS